MKMSKEKRALIALRRDARADLEADSSAQNNGTARTRILLQPHRFYGNRGKSLHASAVAAGSDRSRHGIRRAPAGSGAGAGFAAGNGEKRRM